MNPTERIRWLDAAKGIAIFGVVWLHASPPVEIARYRSFVLPMFFFISGFLFNETKYKNTVDFIKDKAVKILVPYLFFAAFSFIFFVVVPHILLFDVLGIESSNYPGREIQPVLQTLYCVLYSTGDTLGHIANLPLWFLTCFFVAQLLFYFLLRVLKKDAARIIVFFFLSVGGYFLGSQYVSFRLPWGMDTALTAVFFIGAGYYSRRAIPTVEGITKKLNKPLNVLIFVFFFLLHGFLTVVSGMGVDMGKKVYHGYLSLLTALLGIYLYAVISKKLQGVRILNYLGRNSLIIFGFHWPVLKIVKFFLNSVSLPSLPSPAFSLLLAVLTLVCMIPFIFLLNRYLPLIHKQR